MVKTVLEWIGDHKFVIAMDRVMTRDVVCARGKTLGSTFASDIVARICNSFFVGLNDLEKEYEGYYRAEYPSFGAFLFRKYGLSERVITAILGSKSAERLIALGDASGNGDYIVNEMTESDVGWRLLGVLLDLDEEPRSDAEDDEREDEE
jgi:hypothetical protein